MSGKCLSVLLLAGLAAPTQAQGFGQDDDPGLYIAPAKELSFFAHAQGDAYLPARSAGRQGGRVASYGLKTRIGAEIPVDDDTDVTVVVGQTSMGYDFRSWNDFGPGRGDPIDYGLRLELASIFSHQIDEDWSLFGGAYVTTSGEVEALFDDSFTYGGSFGLKHHFHEELSVGLAIVVFGQMEDYTLVFPMPTLNWQIDNYWHIDIGKTLTDLPGAEITYKINDVWTVGVSAALDIYQFRLEDDNNALANGVLEDEAVPVYFMTTYSTDPNFSVTGLIGSAFYRELTLRNNSGNKVGSQRLEPNFALGINCEYRF